MLGSELRVDQKFKTLEMNFRSRCDARNSGNVQPIDLEMKTLVVLDFKGR